MRNIIVLNACNTLASNYGVYSFINTLISVFADKSKYSVYMISIDDDKTKELSVIEHWSHTAINIPMANVVAQRHNYSYVLYLLKNNIQNFKDSIFFINYTIHTPYIEIIKKMCAVSKIVYIIHSHLKELEFKNRILSGSGLSFRDRISLADRIVTISKESFKLLINTNIPSNKLSLITNGLKDKHLKNNDNVSSDTKLLIYTGRISAAKGTDVLLSAFNKVITRFDNCKLVIIGSGDFESISDKIGDSAERIIFTGRISKHKVHQWYKIASIGVFPSLSEECSLTGIEMMMHGLPIISTNGRGVRNMFHNMENSLTVDCRSGNKKFETELYEAMLKLLTNEDLARDLGKKAREWYLNHYQFKQMKQQYIALVEELTQTKFEK